MPLIYKGTTVKKVSYKGTDIKKVYKWKPSTKEYILVFNAAFNAYVRISCWDRTESKSETVHNPAWDTWETNRAAKRAAVDKEASDGLTSWENNNPAPSETNPAYTVWVVKERWEYNKTVDAAKTYEEWKRNNPEPYPSHEWVSVSNPAWDSWNSGRSSYVNDVASAQSAYDEGIRLGYPPQQMEYLRRSLANAQAALASYDSQEPDRYKEEYQETSAHYNWRIANDAESYKVTEADRVYNSWISSNPKPEKENPAYSDWVQSKSSEEARLKAQADAEYNSWLRNNPRPSETITNYYTAYYPNTSVSLVGTPEQATNGWVDVSVHYGGYNRTCRITSSNTYQSWEGSYDRSAHNAASGSATGSDGYSVSNSSFSSWDAGPFEWEYN